MAEPVFSILVVCLNPGDKLRTTLESIREQTFRNYEVIIKDGLSSDGSLDFVKEVTEEFPSLRMIRKKDGGIYDAMNQAVQEAEGRYLYFLNCGDKFYHEKVLEEIAGLIAGHPANAGIYYGNIYERLTGREVASNPRLDAFGLCPATRPVSMTGNFCSPILLRRSIVSGRIMSSFSGAFLRRERRRHLYMVIF